MTVEEFVADLRASAPKHISPDWLGEQQARALIEGLDWQEITMLIAQQQAMSVKKAAETP
jgi:hypothetical protein